MQQCSVQLSFGVNDRVCLFHLAKVMHENIKGSQLVQIEKAGHGFYFEERES
jgi:non-heme chloroperoxidase